MNKEFWLDPELSRRSDDELLFGLLADRLTKLGNVEQERGHEVLVDAHDCVQSTVDEDGTHDRLEDVTEDLWGFKWLNFALIHHEVSVGEGESEEVIDIGATHRVTLGVVEDDVLMEAEKDAQLGNHVIGDKDLLRLMSISAQEIFSKLILVRVHLEVALEKCKSEQIRICKVVQNCVTKDLKFLVVSIQTEPRLATLVGHGLQ